MINAEKVLSLLRRVPFVQHLEGPFARFVGAGSLSEDDALLGLLRFAAMGLVSTVVYFVAAIVLFQGGISARSSSVLAMLLGLLVSFVVQSRVTFRQTGFHMPDAVRFAILGAAGLLVANYSVILLHERGGQPLWVAAAVVCVLIPLTNFLVMNFWVFSRR